ncbi:MAG: hypothetical protein ACREPL_08845 [Rhodanobacteraceae bacterium]
MKRGGGFRFEALDEDGHAGVVDPGSPDRACEAAWERAVLNAAFKRLREEAQQADKLPLFERLSEFLIESPDEADYARVAA